MNWLKTIRHNVNWLRMSWFIGSGGRGHAIRIVAAIAIFFGAAPAWTQNEGAARPNPQNAFSRSSVSGNLAHYIQPQAAQAAPRRDRHTPRMRASSPRKSVTAAAPQPAAPEAPGPAKPA